MHTAYQEIRRRKPDLEVDGEMQGDAALSQEIRDVIMPNSTLKGSANLFIMPNVDAANIAFNMVKTFTDGISIGPILLGAAQPVHILTPQATTRNIVNVSALSSVTAQIAEDDEHDAQAASMAAE